MKLQPPLAGKLEAKDDPVIINVYFGDILLILRNSDRVCIITFYASSGISPGRGVGP